LEVLNDILIEGLGIGFLENIVTTKEVSNYSILPTVGGLPSFD